MPSLFIFTDQYRLIIAFLRGVILIASAMGLTYWALNLFNRTISQKQRLIVSHFALVVAIFLVTLFIDVLYPDIRYSFSYPTFLSLAIVLANLFLVAIIASSVEDRIYKNVVRLTASLSLLITVFLITTPLHRTITLIPPGWSGSTHWLINIFIYYGIACLMIGFFMFFTYPQRAPEWRNGIIALILTSVLIIIIGYTQNRLLDWDLFYFMYVVLIYFVMIFNLIHRPKRGPFYLKNLPIFERADIMMSIVAADGTIRYASHGIAKQIEIVNDLERDTILQADGSLHVLDKDDVIYQWSSHPINSNYLITIENITDLMVELRHKESQRDELERQQIVMGTQSSIDQEIERIEYRLQLLADVEAETKSGVDALRMIISQLSGPITPLTIALVKLMARFVKRRSLIMLESDQRFSAKWINLAAQELLEISFEKNYAVHIHPELELTLEQMKIFQDEILQVALQFPEETELLLTIRQKRPEPEMVLLFRSSQTNHWRRMLLTMYQGRRIDQEDDSLTVVIGLGAN